METRRSKRAVSGKQIKEVEESCVRETRRLKRAVSGKQGGLRELCQGNKEVEENDDGHGDMVGGLSKAIPKKSRERR